MLLILKKEGEKVLIPDEEVAQNTSSSCGWTALGRSLQKSSPVCEWGGCIISAFSIKEIDWVEYSLASTKRKNATVLHERSCHTATSSPMFKKNTFLILLPSFHAVYLSLH